MADKYTDFADLARHERHGVDFAISSQKRRSPVAIIAPHGGKIEFGTSQVATAIAGRDHNLYRFEGSKRRDNFDLHITSTNFDEPICTELVRSSETVVAVHGLEGARHFIEIGGLDEGLRNAICASLRAADFAAEVVTSGPTAGTSPGNICNRGSRGVGVQLEISKGLRDALTKDGVLLERLARAIRTAL